MNYSGYGLLAAWPFLIVMIVLTYFTVLAAVYAVSAWLLGRVFRKAGIPQWKAWVPFYNQWVFLELGGQRGWFAVLLAIPLANIVATVFLCIAAYNIGFAFSKDGAWVILYLIVPWAWWAIIGFDSSRWEPWRSPAPPIYGANVHPPVAPQA